MGNSFVNNPEPQTIIKIVKEYNIDNHDNFVDILNAKKNKDYENIVLSGGGIKGVSLCGVLKYLKDVIWKDNKLRIKRIAGTSAGSIIAAILAVGYNYAEIETIIMNTDYDKICDDKIGYVRDALNFIKDWGIAPGDYVLSLMGELIKGKTNNPDYTINDLYKDHGVLLVITGTNVNKQRTEYFYPGPTGDIPIRKAVRISMSIPLLFEPVHYNNCLFVDGGLLDNYPIHAFDIANDKGCDPGNYESKMGCSKPNPKTLGIKILSADDRDTYIYDKREDVNTLPTYMYQLVDTFLVDNDRKIMLPGNHLRTISIVTKSLPLSQFKLSEQEKQELIKNGEDACIDFFKN